MLARVEFILALTMALLLAAPLAVDAAEPPPSAAQLEFFETRIRPVLVEQCYECHNSSRATEGGLAVDERSALLAGGDSGVIVVPGKPAESRLLAILRHEVEGMKMPKGLGKLGAHVIADFEKWIAMGAPDPRDEAPSADELAEATSWETVLKKRKQWWSFQPIRKLQPPEVPGNNWSAHPIDRFVLQALHAKGLTPVEQADAAILVRRLYFALIGLPPTAEEVEVWTARLNQPAGFDDLVNHLLNNPHYGEHWARHWMDWIRYAESHGSEGDPNIDNAWRYRDYLIRALNQDVPYDQLVREHVAGDLLMQPRINQELGINESMIGPAHWRMVFHGFAPTDALDEKVRFIDDEINTFTKAFLGLTVSCARCHDHKFDPISQRDYYALFGILGSCRPGRVPIDTEEILNKNRDKLAALKPQIRTAVADVWLDAMPELRVQLLSKEGPWQKADKTDLILNPWFQLRKDVTDEAHFAAAWKARVDAWQAERQQRNENAKRTFWRRWDLATQADYSTWFQHGNGLPDKPTAPGEFSIALDGPNGLGGIFPAGVYSNGLTAKHVSRLSSDRVHLDDNYDMWLRVIGESGATARYVVHDYPRNGTVFPVTPLSREWKWQKFDLTYWNGDDIHIELTAGKDAPLLVNNEPRSWFGIREAVIVRKGDPGPGEDREFLDPLYEAALAAPPKSFTDLADCYLRSITDAVKAWKKGAATNAQASLLDACVQQGLLPNQLDELGAAKPSIDEYRRLEAEVVVPTRVPGLEETVARNQRLFERGNHKKPADEVPRRFLEAIDATPYQSPQSGRLQLADNLLRDDNPLTRRVIVNRLWHHLFGVGIVATPDNFGRLGSEPTHPELLDYLATRLQDHGWSMKDAIRFIVTSKTWQLSSRPSAKAQQLDPEDRLLSHAHVRRLEAESIRDALLAVSGTLSGELFGGPVDGNSSRRSVYVRVNRNSLDPFLRVFDFPEPFSATGRRDVTNVPAQSLTLLNDDRVATLAAAWASSLLANPKLARDEDRIQAMFSTAFARPAASVDVQRSQEYLAATKARYTEMANQIAALRTQIERRQLAIRSMMDPVRNRLVAEAKAKSAAGEQLVPKPIGRWEFESDLKDVTGPAHGDARDGARIENGMLVVGKQAHVITAPIKQTLKAKTLEAWVQLDTLDQSGGGVMTIQTRDGVTFDAIVFAEANPRQWMAGSNGFVRTQPFNGPQDQEAGTRPVHVAITYRDDGLITGYRDGQPYGKAYQSNGPQEFKAGETVIGFGIRHLPAGGNRMLAGRILRAQLYDRALTADEIQATATSAPYFVAESQVLAALTEVDRKQITADRQRIRELETEVDSLGTVPEAVNDKALWTELARAIFTFKEFIYLK